MKKIITLITMLLLIGPVFSQTKVNSFYKAFTDNPLVEKVKIIDLRGKNLKSDTLRVLSLKKYSPERKNIKYYKEIGQIIDKANLIEYKSDTLYILSTFYTQDNIILTTINTHKGIFVVNKDENEDFRIYSLDEYYTGVSDRIKKTDELLYNSIFNWDINFLVDIINATSVGFDDNIYISATKIILKDNEVMKKDIIFFDPPLSWIMEDSNHSN